MRNLPLSAALAALTLVHAEKAPGSIFRIKTISNTATDQVRILTQPRAGYNPANDHPSVYSEDLTGQCEEVTAVDFIFASINDKSQCCKLKSLDGFNIWAEKQDYTIPKGANIVAQESFNKGASCYRRTNEKKVKSYKLKVGQTYNSYMAQAWSHDNSLLKTNNVIEFHNQDVVAVIWQTSKIQASDKYFTIGGASTYSNVRSDKWRGLELGSENHESFHLNCEVRPTPVQCPAAAATVVSDVEVTDNSCEGRGWGDPHMVTWDGLRYDVHVKGELILVKSLNSEFEIQGRTEAVENHPSRPAVTTGIVVNEIGDNPTIQVSLARDASGTYTEELRAAKCTGNTCNCPVQLFVDGVERPVSDGTGSDKASVTVTEVGSGNKKGKRVTIQYPETNVKVTMDVRNWKQTCHFSVTYTLADCRPNDNIVGLIGSPNGDWRDDWMERDGTPIPIPPNLQRGAGFEPTYNYTRDNWCINEEADSYFQYEANTNFALFDECDNPYDPSLEIAVANADAATVAQCNGDVFCIVDDLALGTEASNAYLEDPALTHTVKQTTSTEVDIVYQVPDESPDPNCPVCKARGWGDPHIISFDGVTYDVHAKGELTFIKSLDTDFTIQARTEVVANHPKGPAVTTAVVVHEDSTLALPVVQVSLGASPNSELATMFDECPVQLFVDGVAKDIRVGTGVSGAVVQVKDKRIVVEYPSTNLRVTLDVKVWRSACHFSVDYFLGDCRCDETLVGILGQPDGDAYNEWHEHDGTPVPIPSDRRKRRGQEAYDYSLTWCISETESKFTYEPSRDHAFFDQCTPDNFDVDIDDLIDNVDEETANTCTIDGALDEGCVVECVYLGPLACAEYVNVVKESVTVEITDGPTLSPTKIQRTEFDDVPVANDQTDAGPSGSLGDPHFKSWKNEHFEFHGQCDLVLTRDPKFANGLGMDVHIRTKLVRYWSYIKNAAIRIGNDILEVQGSTDGDDQTKAIYWYNLEYQGKMTHIGGFPVTVSISKAKFHKRTFEIDLSSKYPGQKIVISTFHEFVRVDFVNASFEAFGKTTGMLGDFETGNTLARDGETVMNNFHDFGNEWQVLPTENMLFHRVSDPQFPKRCILPEDPRGDRRRRLGEESISAEEAEAACAKTLSDPLDIKDCVYDILATQNLEMVGAF